MRSSTLVSRAGLALVLLAYNFLPAWAQTSTPTNTWVPAPTCSAGSNDTAANGGRYTDRFNNVWETRCGQAHTGPLGWNSLTNGQGYYGCVKGCARRPGCTAFTYISSGSGQTSPTTGSGSCQYRTDKGEYTAGGSTTYASAHLIVAGRGNNSLPCQGYANDTFIDIRGDAWEVICERDIVETTLATPSSFTGQVDMLTCIQRCNSATNCHSFRYEYSPANFDERQDSQEGVQAGAGFDDIYDVADNHNFDNFHHIDHVDHYVYHVVHNRLFHDVGHNYVNYISHVTLVNHIDHFHYNHHVSLFDVLHYFTDVHYFDHVDHILIFDVLHYFDHVSHISHIDHIYNFARIVDNHEIHNINYIHDYCWPLHRYTNSIITGHLPLDTDPSQATGTQAANIHECMQKCDAFPGCKAATYDGTCYMKTSFTGVRTSNNANLGALVRYVPPNPNYVAPVTSAGGGCGQPLPSNLTANGPSVQFSMRTTADGFTRTFLIHIPQYYDINKASPLIIGFHGQYGTSADIESQLGFNDPGLNPYAIVVYAQGSGTDTGWESNPEYGVPGSPNPNVRDREFMKELVALMKNTFCIDRTRVFAAGHSNGGGFCGVIACDPELSLIFAAIAPNAGAFYTSSSNADPYTVDTNTPVQQQCSPGRNDLAIFETHGTTDGTIGYWGGERRGRTLPTIPHWLNNWAIRQGLSTNNVTTNLATDVTQVQWGGGRIQHFRLENFGHAYPTSTPINIRPYVMDFFYRWNNPNAPHNFPCFYNGLNDGLDDVF
ncbi:hypothetical protein WHR41_06796 [Cladosporium halotolerans]|uniref:feruloyl esterase n=1 Tax=Cladosporium halotolerans TaxID=1052096 RepID=A0AB34KLZ4_9PEZI